MRRWSYQTFDKNQHPVSHGTEDAESTTDAAQAVAQQWNAGAVFSSAFGGSSYTRYVFTDGLSPFRAKLVIHVELPGRDC